MTDEMKKQRLAAATKALDEVQAAMYAVLKPYGFRKHGRVFHRFVEGDVSQVVELQRGQAYLEKTHLFWVSVGIRVPECQLRTFAPGGPEKFYRESACSMRYTLGERSKKKTGAYDLRKPVGPMIEDILARLASSVLPMFEALNSRDAILEKRRAYPQFCLGHLVLLDEAMIHGRRGDLARAEELFNEHYRTCGDERYPEAAAAHRTALRELAERLGIAILAIKDESPEV